MRPDGVAGLPVARYLRPEEAVVPFRDRPELGELLAWCTGGEERAGVRLVAGDGGAGKTRLALRLGRELAACGWRALWVPRGAERDAAGAVRTVGEPCVLVVDYAETRTDLAGLVADVAGDEDGPEVRVALLARSAGEWWQQLVAGAEGPAAALLEAHAPLMLGPVRAAGGPQEIFAEALAAFAGKLGTTCPNARLTVTDPDPVVLVVHAAALLAVADQAAGNSCEETVVSGEATLEGLLRHEAGYWVRSAAGRGLELDVSVLRLAVAVACLIGAENQTGAVALLARVPDLDSAERRGRVARWLHDLYPAPAGTDEVAAGEWLGPLRPDRLAEHLVAGELTQRPELAGSWFTGLGEGRAGRALTVLARAALTQQRAVPLLRAALAADLDQLAVPALAVAVATNPVVGDLLARVLAGQPVPRETLRRVADQSSYPSFALAAPAATALQLLADDPAAESESERARTLVDLSNRLGDLGRPEEALDVIEQAAGIYGQLAADRPDAYLPNLATSLNNQSNRLADLGRLEEALDVIEQAVTIRRQLAADQPDAYLPNLATSLNNQSNRLADLGRLEEALDVIEQAVTIRRQLAADQPDAFLPDLAMSLNNQSNRLGDLGRLEEALDAIEQAVTIRRQLAADRPDAFLPDLAMSLNNQSNQLGDLGRPEEALDAIEQAAGIYGQLAADRPGAFLPDLAASLNNQSACLGDLGRPEEALDAIEQAVTIRRQLAADRPDAYLPDLATSLNNQSLRLGDLGRPEEALEAIEQAADIYRQLALHRPGVSTPKLAASLNNLAAILSALGRDAEAAAARGEAATAMNALKPPARRAPDSG